MDADGALLGVVSAADLLVKEQGAGAIRHRPLARFLGESRQSVAQLAKVGAITAGEAMSLAADHHHVGPTGHRGRRHHDLPPGQSPAGRR